MPFQFYFFPLLFLSLAGLFLFFAPLFFRFIPDVRFGEGGFITHHEVVHEAHEHGLRGFGGDAAGPGLFLVKFVFELVVNLLQIPAAAV